MLVTLDVGLGWGDQREFWIQASLSITDAFFLGLLFVNALTAVQTRAGFELNPIPLLIRYAKGRLAVDLLGALPLDSIFSQQAGFQRAAPPLGRRLL